MNPSAHFESYRLKLLPLCPIHVGSGNVIEPFEYDLEQEQKNDHGRLQVYDVEALLSSLNDRQRGEFEQRNNEGWHEVRTWLREQFRGKEPRFSLVVKKAAAQKIGESLNDRNRAGEIHLLCRNPIDNQAYIPGSSVKGAIRTALLDAEADIAEPPTKDKLNQLASNVRQGRNSPGQESRLEQQFQATALDYLDDKKRDRPNLNRDPFRQVAIADFPVPEEMTSIDQIKIFSKRDVQDSDPGKILMFRELTNAALSRREEEITLHSELRIFSKLHNAPVMQSDRLSLPIGWEQIRDACNDFYGPRFEDEVHTHVQSDAIKKLLNECREKVRDNDCLIRLGRHSHFECVTIDLAFTKTPRMGHGKTRSFVQGVCPLGWARLSVETHP